VIHRDKFNQIDLLTHVEDVPRISLFFNFGLYSCCNIGLRIFLVGDFMGHNTDFFLTKTEATSTSGMVATKHRLATEAGLSILQLGGNAIDAGIAACFAVGVVEPESSGIGGGGYMVFQMGQSGGVIGFPMKGPLSATEDMFTLSGEESTGSFGWAGVKGDENIHGYKSIAIPGCVAGLMEAHRRHGTVPLKDILAPAIELANKGFSPDWFTLYKLGSLSEMILRYTELKRTFMPNNALPYGSIDNAFILKQPELANALDSISKYEHEGFYRSDLTKMIVDDVQSNGGIISMNDFNQYQAFYWDKGLEFNYRDKLVRVPPMASAGITTAMTLKILEGYDLEDMGHNSAQSLHAYISAAKLAYADRFEYIADPEHADVPWHGLISDGYAARRRQDIAEQAPEKYRHGNPWKEEGRKPKSVLKGSNPSPDTGTTHLTVIDKDGNAVSITNTIMSGFGSGIIPKDSGIIMNNGMMWYDPVPKRVNSIAPGKYPLNNMSPALVIGKHGVEIAVGASGGRRITNCVSSLLVNMIDFDMGPQQAIDVPRVDCSSETIDVDTNMDGNVISDLKNKGHNIRILGQEYSQTGLAKFASPVAIRKNGNHFRGGVDTFHSAHAAGT